MLIVNKKIGETPLETLDRLRRQKAKYLKEKLSYAGRLDPMAEGKMLVLAGEKENREREKYLRFDKEYIAEFVIGAETDSGDILGVVSRSGRNPSGGEILAGVIKKAVSGLRKIRRQKYPWFSGKTIGGVKMFELYKVGQTAGVRRPTLAVAIKRIGDLKISFISSVALEKEILKKIALVRGDFRQKAIAKEWLEFFAGGSRKKFQRFSFRFRVSGGTFIRAFAEYFKKEFGAPVFLRRLKRTRIFSKI